jgi:hypothetical protein
VAWCWVLAALLLLVLRPRLAASRLRLAAATADGLSATASTLARALAMRGCVAWPLLACCLRSGEGPQRLRPPHRRAANPSWRHRYSPALLVLDASTRWLSRLPCSRDRLAERQGKKAGLLNGLWIGFSTPHIGLLKYTQKWPRKETSTTTRLQPPLGATRTPPAPSSLWLMPQIFIGGEAGGLRGVPMARSRPSPSPGGRSIRERPTIRTSQTCVHLDRLHANLQTGWSCLL